MVTSREQMYPDTKLFIDGSWRDGTSGKVEPILNPATGKLIGTVAHASIPISTTHLNRPCAGSNCGGGRLPSSDTN